ncbi:MAG: hypothetical protein M1401_00375, partial [Chloroflexi bacterium]|nr:hypothetical protein [Chloroflexota bacterium]
MERPDAERGDDPPAANSPADPSAAAEPAPSVGSDGPGDGPESGQKRPRPSNPAGGRGGRRRGLGWLLPYLGPSFVASVAYMDPGNFATNIQGGAKFGYTLLWV